MLGCYMSHLLANYYLGQREERKINMNSGTKIGSFSISGEFFFLENDFKNSLWMNKYKYFLKLKQFYYHKLTNLIMMNQKEMQKSPHHFH